MTRSENDVGRMLAQYLTLHKIFFYRNNNTPIFQVERKLRGKSIGHFRAQHQDTPNGLPDYIAIIHSYYVGLETKAPGKDLSKEQKEVRARIEKAGGFYFKIDCSEDLVAAIEIVKQVIVERRLGKA